MTRVFKGVFALVVAFAAGVAMSFGQTYGPDWLAPMFNSAAPVVAVAGLAVAGLALAGLAVAGLASVATGSISDSVRRVRCVALLLYSNAR